MFWPFPRVCSRFVGCLVCASNAIVVCFLVSIALQLDAAWMDVKRYEATVDAEYAAVQAERAALLQREVRKCFGS